MVIFVVRDKQPRKGYITLITQTRTTIERRSPGTRSMVTSG